MNDLVGCASCFAGLPPYSGPVQEGFIVDWARMITEKEFFSWNSRQVENSGSAWVQTSTPTIADGEGWFEYYNWVAAAREARGSYVMITLGACFGAQAVGSALTLKRINPMPFKLVAVEPEPTNIEFVKRHMRNNGIDPDDHWIVGSALGVDNRPIFFPVGGPGSGSQNCFSTNDESAREHYARALSHSENHHDAIRNLVVNGSTGITKMLIQDPAIDAEIKLVSSVKLVDILSPFDRVDYLESDIQQSEAIIFHPAMEMMKKKVRRCHIGTHGLDTHQMLVNLFKDNGWEIVFDYVPNSTFETPYGPFETNDGILTVINPDLKRG